MAKTTNRNQIRYNLHHKVRSQGFELNTQKREIQVNPSVKLTKQVKRLQREFGYNLQTYIE